VSTIRSTSRAVKVPSALTPTFALNTSAWREFCRKLSSAEGQAHLPILRDKRAAKVRALEFSSQIRHRRRNAHELCQLDAGTQIQRRRAGELVGIQISAAMT
jgi:hypothetical protein